MEPKIFAFALLVLLEVSLACNVSFYKDVNVRVVDESYRPVEDALVSVYYQVSYSVQENGKPIYAYSNEKPTDLHGLAIIGIKNNEPDPSKVDCKIKVNVRKFNYNIEKQFDLDNAPYELLIKIPAYRLSIRSVDEFNNKVESRIIINNQTFNSTGSSFFMLPQGKYEIFIAHKYNKKFFDYDIKQDSSIDSVFSYVPVNIKVYDDKGNALDYKIYIENEIFNSIDGTTHQLLSGNFDAIIEVLGTKRTVRIDTSSKKDYSFIYDINAPTISQVSFITKDGKTYIKANIIDEGRYASGVAKVNAVLVFENGNSYSIPLDSDYYNDYIGAVDQTGSLLFELYVLDKEGNSVKASGNYKYQTGQENSSTEKLNLPESEDKSFVDSIVSWIFENFLTVALVIIVLGIAFYMISKKTEES